MLNLLFPTMESGVESGCNFVKREFTLLLFASPSLSVHCQQFIRNKFVPFVYRTYEGKMREEGEENNDRLENGNYTSTLKDPERCISCILVCQDSKLSTETSHLTTKRRRRFRNRLCRFEDFDMKIFDHTLYPTHKNFATLHNLLGVVGVPMVVVIRNYDGRVVTTAGRDAIEGCRINRGDEDWVLDRWRQGADDVRLRSRVCTVS